MDSVGIETSASFLGYLRRWSRRRQHMDTLHQLYVTFTEQGWLPALGVSCVLAMLLASKMVSLTFAKSVLCFGLLVTLGWLALDLAFYPGSHNLLPFEVLFKLVLVAPLGIALRFKKRHARIA